MSLFGASRPKGITKEELTFVRGELKNAPFGHSGEALTEHQTDEIIRRLELCLDPDSAIDIKNHWGQAGQEEVNMINTQVANDRNLHLSDTQKMHVKTVLQKYIDIDKHKSAFSI